MKVDLEFDFDCCQRQILEIGIGPEGVECQCITCRHYEEIPEQEEQPPKNMAFYMFLLFAGISIGIVIGGILP